MISAGEARLAGMEPGTSSYRALENRLKIQDRQLSTLNRTYSKIEQESGGIPVLQAQKQTLVQRRGKLVQQRQAIAQIPGQYKKVEAIQTTVTATGEQIDGIKAGISELGADKQQLESLLVSTTDETVQAGLRRDIDRIKQTIEAKTKELSRREEELAQAEELLKAETEKATALSAAAESGAYSKFSVVRGNGEPPRLALQDKRQPRPTA